MVSAATGGSLEAVQWLWDKDFPWNGAVLSAAGSGGHRKILRWLEEASVLPPPEFRTFLKGSCKSGDLEIATWFLERGFRVDLASGAEVATAEGHLPLLKWLWEEDQKEREADWKRQEREEDEQEERRESAKRRWKEEQEEELEEILKKILKTTAAYGHVDVLEWAWNTLPHGELNVNHFLQDAAGNRQFGVFKFLILNTEATVTKNMLINAARTRGFDIVRWIVDNDYERDPEVLEWIVYFGDVEMAKWAREKGFAWGVGMYENAIEGTVERMKGRRRWREEEESAMLDWLVDNGCPWVGTIPAKVLHSLEDMYVITKLIAWVQKKNLKWDVRNLFWVGLSRGMVEALDWLMEHQERKARDAMEQILKKSYIDRVRVAHVLPPVFTWMKNHGFEIPVEKFFVLGVRKDSVEILDWLKDNGYHVSLKMLQERREESYICSDIVRWVGSNGDFFVEQI
jgi:hypothetical protein